MQLSLGESTNHHEIQIANVSIPLTLTPGLQLKHQTKLCEPVAYEINHLEMSVRTHNRLTNDLLNKTKIRYTSTYDYHRGGQEY